MRLTKEPLNFVSVFGGVLVVLVARYFVHGWIDAQFHAPRMLFPWEGLEWIRPWPRPWMHVHFAALGVLAVALAAGLWVRPAAGLFCAGFTWVHLIDRTNYLNHYYLISLVTGLIAVVPRERLSTALRFQVAVVYVFAGIAKLQPDWLLRAQPMRIWLADVPLLSEPWIAFAMSWAGTAYDLAIPFLLMGRRTRPWAFATAVVFHVATALLFPIGLFPWVMLACLRVFFDEKERGPAEASPRWALAFGAYAAVQILVPLLALREPHDVRFAWRVMVAEKSAAMRVRVGGREIAPSDHLTPLQMRGVPSTPDLLDAFLRRLHAETGRPVEAEVAVSVNGRPCGEGLRKHPEVYSPHAADR